MKVDESKLKTVSIQDIENDLKEIQKEFDNDTLMNPMSYARMKELTTYRKTLQEELMKRKQKQNMCMSTNVTIIIPDKEMEHINDLLKLTGEEIYQKYGYKREETITHTAVFPNGIKADIKLVICEEESPYTEGVLFLNGHEMQCTDPESTYDGEWHFDHNGTDYVVTVKSESAKE